MTVARWSFLIAGARRSLARRRRRPAPADDLDLQLEVCGMCGADFVNPVEWQTLGPDAWRILLRCGECETWREVIVANAVANRYDVELDRRVTVLLAMLDRLDRERMVGEVEAMVIALEGGLIDAGDFG